MAGFGCPPRLCRLETSKLLGWDETLYYRSLEKMVGPETPLFHAVLVGIHTLVVAEETSNSVRGPMAVSVLSRRGIFEEPQEDLKATVDRMKQYENEISKLFVLYSDVTTPSIEFEDQLEEFSRRAVALRKTHVETEVRRMFNSGFDTRNWPYVKFPVGVGVTLDNKGDLTVIQGGAGLKALEDAAKAAGIPLPPKQEAN